MSRTFGAHNERVKYAKYYKRMKLIFWSAARLYDKIIISIKVNDRKRSDVDRVSKLRLSSVRPIASLLILAKFPAPNECNALLHVEFRIEAIE